MFSWTSETLFESVEGLLPLSFFLFFSFFLDVTFSDISLDAKTSQKLLLDSWGNKSKTTRTRASHETPRQRSSV